MRGAPVWSVKQPPPAPPVTPVMTRTSAGTPTDAVAVTSAAAMETSGDWTLNCGNCADLRRRICRRPSCCGSRTGPPPPPNGRISTTSSAKSSLGIAQAIVTDDPVAGDVAPAHDAAAPVPVRDLMNRLVDGAVAEVIPDPAHMNPAIRFPLVFDASAAVATVVAVGRFAVTAVPCASATVAPAPENPIDPPEMFAGVPPATVATTFAVPAAAMIPNTWRNPAVILPACTTPRLVIADPPYLQVHDRPPSAPVSTEIAASSTTLAPTTVWENVSVVTPAAVAPADDGPTLSNATATGSPPHLESSGTVSSSRRRSRTAACTCSTRTRSSRTSPTPT